MDSLPLGGARGTLSQGTGRRTAVQSTTTNQLTSLYSYPSGGRVTLRFSASVGLLGNPPAYELRPFVVARGVLDPEAYVGSESLVIVVGVIHCHVFAPVLPREGLVGNLLRE